MILMVGGTGDLGSRVVRRLLAEGQQVRCLVRPGSERSLPEGAEAAAGDLTERGSLRSACQGVDVVVATASVLSRRLAGGKGPSIREADEAGMASLIEAAETSGVQRFVYVSLAGVEASLGNPLERAKRATERRLEASPMRRVIVRPDAFQEIHLGPLGRFDVPAGKVAVIGRGDNRRRWVATEDVAALVAAVALEADPPELIEVGGPELLSRNEAVAVAERASGRQLKVQRMPLPAARLAVRLLARSKDGLASVLALGILLDQDEVTWDDAPLRSRGISPRSATEWITLQTSSL